MRRSGMAHGWEGCVWVRLRSGKLDACTVRAIERGGDPGGGAGAFDGRGGAALVAMLAAKHERRLAARAAHLVGSWNAARNPVSDDDVFAGHPGALLAASELAAVAGWAPPSAFLRRCHARTIASLRSLLAQDAPLLGMAHGLAGIMLAAECAAARFGLARPRALLERAFDRLAGSRALAPGLGVVWPTAAGSSDFSRQSWCAGTPGIALALAACYRYTGAAHYRDLLELATPAIAALPSANQTLCCGRAGRAHILVELGRVADARTVAACPVRPGFYAGAPGSLMQGTTGVAYLSARLAAPTLPLPGLGW